MKNVFEFKNGFISKYLNNLPWIVFASIFQAISLSSFSVPGQMYSGGILGLSRLISDVLSDFFNVNFNYSILLMIINIFLAFFVFAYIGKIFTLLSLTEICLVSILSNVFKQYIFIDDLMLISIFGGIVNGFGVGLALSHNASTGGTDFISIFLSKKYKKSMWNAIFIFNCFLIVSTGLIYGWERALYSIIYQFCSTQVVNRMHKRYTSQTITIITAYPDEVSNEIFDTIRHGITELKAVGAYKKTETTMLYTVVNAYQTNDVIKAIMKVDRKAFINVQETSLVIGNYYQKPLD